MMNFLSQYGLFLAKVLTISLGIIFTFLGIIIIAARFKGQGQDGTLLIENINDRLDEVTDLLDKEMLSKSQYKAKIKARKKLKPILDSENPKLFVLHFDGDIKASQVNNLRESITAIINIATPNDEVLVVLESGGGFVPHYGLAASQLARLRKRQIPLTIAIDKIAASGGYLMACVANKIICAPFAIIGSIGVIAMVPNVRDLLKQHHINIEQHTAGQYKRTLTMFGENTDEAREKFKEELNDTHLHFQDFIAQYRPQVDLEKTATGEHWSGDKAKTLNLVDELETSDDYILNKHPDYKIFQISFVTKTSLKEKLATGLSGSISKVVDTLLNKVLHLKNYSL